MSRRETPPHTGGGPPCDRGPGLGPEGSRSDAALGDKILGGGGPEQTMVDTILQQ